MSTTTDAKDARRPAATDRTMIDSRRPPSGDDTVVQAVRLGPGLRIDQYELIRELGRGGMGQVFLARDTRLGRKVAMKFLASRSRRFTERFLVEARATARCSHEHIVVIHDVDEYLGLPYMVLEYVEGITLARMMTDKRLPVGRAVELIVPVVKALVRAHDANIIHRDLKPENIVVTMSGTVKVLDFGIAKLFAAPDESDATAPSPSKRAPTVSGDLGGTRPEGLPGTLPYMSPEQLGSDQVDHRTDLWAIGIILYQMVAGKHPLDPVTQSRLVAAASALDDPMPSVGDDAPGLPDRFVQIVDRCLAKRKTERYTTAAELLADLEPLMPRRVGRSLVADESPYPGLTAFQESDANRFFGRAQDVAAMVARLRDHPLVGVVGPSGVGKSSFVRAGVIPALRSSGDPWDVLLVRPGRHPLSALASTLETLRESRDSDPILDEEPAKKLRLEPGTFGARLRARARRKRSQVLLFVDQHEELYTLVTDPAERIAFTACLAGAADDPAGPVRVVVAMRPDFLDRAAEDRAFVEELTRSLVFLQPPSRAGLEEALTAPLKVLGYAFEPGVVEAMLETLAATPGALPLLQFTAARLWETRDGQRRVLTRRSYEAMGGVEGALATHADDVLAALSAPDQRTVRRLFERLVTPERTRAIVEARELRDVAPDVERVIDLLVAARLLVVQTRAAGERAVELVHESLIRSWPTLQRWLDENQEGATYLAQVRAAAKQWEAKGRPPGLLWRGEAMQEARLWRSRFRGMLPALEQEFLDAVIALGTRAARIRRGLALGTIAFLAVLVAAALTGLVWIRGAEQAARDEAARAREAEIMATQAADRARAAEQKAAAEREAAKQALAAKHAEERAKQQAEEKAAAAHAQVAVTQAEAHRASERAARAERDRKRAEAEKASAVQKEEERRRAEKRRSITSDLK